MSNLKEIRSRISSVSSTMKITSAMKMVSAAKLKKAQDQMQNIKPYSEALKNSINNLLPNISASEVTLLKSHSIENKKLIIAISSNRGLCGGFNANIFKKAKQQKIQKTDDIYCVGKKIIDQFSRTDHKVISKEIEVLDSGRLSLGSLKHRHGAGGRPHPTAVARDRPKGWESKAPGPGACA